MTAVTGFTIALSTYVTGEVATWSIGLTPSAAGTLALVTDSIRVSKDTAWDSEFAGIVIGDVAIGTGFDPASFPLGVTDIGAEKSFTFDPNGQPTYLLALTPGVFTVANLTNPAAGTYAAANFKIRTNRDTTFVNLGSDIVITNPPPPSRGLMLMGVG